MSTAPVMLADMPFRIPQKFQFVVAESPRMQFYRIYVGLHPIGHSRSAIRVSELLRFRATDRIDPSQ
jgi:hypothetical protein